VRHITALILVLALLFLTLGKTSAETYVEGFIGNNFSVTSPDPIEFNVNPNYKAIKTFPEYPRSVSSKILFGGKLGTWFSKDGFPHFDYPDWMKYLGFYLDFTANGLDYAREVGSRRMYVSPVNVPPSPFPFQHYKFLGKGNVMTIGFMFACRYGFLPTEKVPFGKFQPYLALGPAICITTLRPTLMFQPISELVFPAIETYQEFRGPRRSSVSIGLATELGLRFMITRFLSVDTSVKYRYTSTSISYDIKAEGFAHQLRYSPQLNMFSIQTGVAYHF
jgi:hypothetical protein